MIVFRTRNDVLVRTRDGREFTIEEPIDLASDTGARYRVPAGAVTDGASTPALLWVRLPPFGPYWLAAVIHDSAYRGTLLRQLENDQWAPAMLNKPQCDALFLDCMAALGVDFETKNELFEGVHIGGWKAFNDDRKIL